ncbi:major facilitator superfamily domain-containing protein [Zychaea mexicana]|uniref:major facilitator superfamily domain-containing protein n=1 Tax=Zychaea mexicana TaxID=64656 RepID=UPI0022FDEB8A|nr:major facilitator superfamily domain-containing protein [Zychaea mexicana]KAI9479530.1 major facilitator superfamily domain-containing protein [Zychaea mexicana]
MWKRRTLSPPNSKRFVYTPEEEKLLRKINIMTVPYICVICFLQYLDKTILNTSSVMGLFEDTKITGNQFGWLGSIYYLGYLSLQFPNQYLLQKIPISKYLGTALIVWGTILGCTAFATNFAQMAALRFLLGFAEAASYPALYLLVSIIYRRSEQVTWFGVIQMSSAFAGAFGGLISFGFLRNMNGVYGLSAWKWNMIILGAITVGVGICTFLFLPDTAKSRWYRLTLQETQIVDERIRDNTVVQNKKIKSEQLLEAIKEPRFYCMSLIPFFDNMVNGVTSIFSTLIIKSMGFSNLESTLLNIPLGITSAILDFTAIYLSHRYNENCYVGCLMAFIVVIGLLLLVVLPTGGVMLMGIFILSIGSVDIFPALLVANNVNGYSKKVLYNSANLVSYCLGNFVGPLLMREEQAPRYLGGMITYLVVMLLVTFLFLYVRWTYVQDNQYRLHLKAEESQQVPLPSMKEDCKPVDCTDKQDLLFLYRP